MNASSGTAGLNVLVLQGGGALGSYQAGVVEAVHAKSSLINWAAGVSIGAINSALIVGNPPERRIERLRAFWELVTSGTDALWWPSDGVHAAANQFNAAMVAVMGVPGFFRHYFPPRALYAAGLPGPISFYDTTPLKETLLRFIDFDLINAKKARLSVGAVDVQTGNVVFFDNFKEEIRPEHILASGALPPGFPPVEIGGRFYWDGGLVSNTPLQYVFDCAVDEDLTILQVDLFPARGPLPTTLDEASVREKDIRYSSRTRLNTDDQVAMHRTKAAFRRLLKKLPPELRDDPDVVQLAARAREPSITIFQLIYRSRPYEGSAKDYEFSRATMMEHWAAGLQDAKHSLDHPDWQRLKTPEHGVVVYDLTPSRSRPSRRDEA